MKHPYLAPAPRTPAKEPNVRIHRNPLLVSFTVVEHPTLTRAREILGLALVGTPRLRRRSGSFAFSV